jgi:hypothetical protein
VRAGVIDMAPGYAAAQTSASQPAAVPAIMSAYPSRYVG